MGTQNLWSTWALHTGESYKLMDGIVAPSIRGCEGIFLGACILPRSKWWRCRSANPRKVRSHTEIGSVCGGNPKSYAHKRTELCYVHDYKDTTQSWNRICRSQSQNFVAPGDALIWPWYLPQYEQRNSSLRTRKKLFSQGIRGRILFCICLYGRVVLLGYALVGICHVLGTFQCRQICKVQEYRGYHLFSYPL
jgi:hypothetical protein